MKTLLQISSALNYGSTGKIAEQIGLLAKAQGWRSCIAHGNKYKNPSQLETYQVVTPWQELEHEAKSLLFDAHGLGSAKETAKLCRWIDEISPDIIHLHNIHGYYLNYEVLFKYLQHTDTPIIWTLHDCWSFTGHCAYFDFIGCDRWKTGCSHCPGRWTYPKSFVDRSKHNWELKRDLFSSVSDRLTIAAVSDWLAGFVKASFLSGADIRTIHNGVDLNIFSPKETASLQSRIETAGKYVIMGCAFPWSKRKGLDDWVKLRALLPEDKYALVVVGLNNSQLESPPKGIIGIGRTNSQEELAEYYSLADVFVNTTYEDNFPTVNLEALACGTPVVTYRTGGSPESIDDGRPIKSSDSVIEYQTGYVVDKGDLASAVSAIESICASDRFALKLLCRQRAVEHFNKDKCFEEYVGLYEETLEWKM